MKKNRLQLVLEIDGKRIRIEDKLELNLFNSSLSEEMCVPERIESGKFYKFCVKGWRIFPFQRPILLFSTGDNNPLASIEIIIQTAYIFGDSVNTKGEYYVRNIGK